MDTMTAILRRTSYRGMYTSVPIPVEHLMRILEAGLAAPSGCNKQTTSLIAVDDPALLRRLADLLQKPSCASAPAMICVLTQRLIASGDRSFSVQDYSAAIENMLLEITELGYASCWIEGRITNNDTMGRKMADVLGVPPDYELICALPVGVPETQPESTAVKKSFSERAWYNCFGAQF